MRVVVSLALLFLVLGGIGWYVWLVSSGQTQPNWLLLFFITAFLVGVGSGVIRELRKKPEEAQGEKPKGKTQGKKSRSNKQK